MIPKLNRIVTRRYIYYVVDCTTKTSEGHCHLEVQPMEQFPPAVSVAATTREISSAISTVVGGRGSIVLQYTRGHNALLIFDSAIHVKKDYSVERSDPKDLSTLKGQCHKIFCFWFFSSISFPPAPEYPIRTVSKFFENSRRYSQLEVDHRCR